MARFDVNRYESNDWKTARFFSSARDGKYKVLRSLIPQVDCTLRDYDGRTALMHAAAMAQSQCVQILLPVIDARLCDHDSFTALMRAAIHHPLTCPAQRLDCLAQLLPHSDADAVNASGSNALMLAIKSGNTIGARFLLSHTNLANTNRRGQTANELMVLHRKQVSI